MRMTIFDNLFRKKKEQEKHEPTPEEIAKQKEMTEIREITGITEITVVTVITEKCSDNREMQ